MRRSTGIYIEGGDGNLVAQADYGLPSAACHIAIIDTRNFEPGAYTVYVLVYGWENGERLPGDSGRGSRGSAEAE